MAWLLLACNAAAFAQVNTAMPDSSAAVDSSGAIIAPSPIAASLPASGDSDTSGTPAQFIMHKSPLGALLRSAVVPGLGQIYNESYWKAPVVWTAIGIMAYYWDWNNRRYNNYASLYRMNQQRIYRDNRDFYRDQRDLVAIYIGLTYALNLLDAYVDAHLFDFSVEEDPVTNAPRLNMKLSF